MSFGGTPLRGFRPRADYRRAHVPGGTYFFTSTPIGAKRRDETDFNRHIDYIHWNPVKHGYVAQVSHWPYSSFHRYLKQGWLPANWGSTIEPLNGADFGE